jgi:hypothetical protein
MRIETYYFDENGTPTDDKSKAVTVIIRELDESGNLVKETYGHISKEAPQDCAFFVLNEYGG